MTVNDLTLLDLDFEVKDALAQGSSNLTVVDNEFSENVPCIISSKSIAKNDSVMLRYPQVDQVEVGEANTVLRFNDNSYSSVTDPIAIDDTVQLHISPLVKSAEESLSSVYQQAALFNPSPLRPHVILHWLDGYDPHDKAQLSYDLTQGVRIPSSMQPPSTYAMFNHPSALQNRDKVAPMIQQGVQDGIIAGPFKCPPQV